MARKPAKPARRKPGTGSIRHKAGREKPWEAAFPLSRHEYRYDSFATEAAARAHLDRLTSERDHADTPRNIAGGSQYLEAFLVAFLNRKAVKVKAKTLADYTYQCGLANEYFGVCRIDAIDRTAADALLLHYARRGYHNAPHLVQRHLTVSRSCFIRLPFAATPGMSHCAPPRSARPCASAQAVHWQTDVDPQTAHQAHRRD